MIERDRGNGRLERQAGGSGGAVGEWDWVANRNGESG